MNPMPHGPFGAVPQGMRWCPHCNGYRSLPKEAAQRYAHCAGTGLVVDEAAALSDEGAGNDSAAGGEPRGG
jgi:hypothetical protein